MSIDAKCLRVSLEDNKLSGKYEIITKS